jgi:uncharacterized damage-inducible protein DinB
MDQEIHRITNMLREIYEGGPWHGPSITKVLSDISPQQALSVLQDSHNIIELVLHMTAWRNFVIRRLEGDERYEVSEDENFKIITNVTDEAWETAKKALAKSQKKLITLLSQCYDDQLLKTVANRSYNYYVLLHGILQHDVYHLGQMALLKKQEK